MPALKLPSLFSKPAEGKTEKFLVVWLIDHCVQAVLWQAGNNRVEILSQSAQHAWKDTESCVNAIDQSLQELGKESEDIQSTLFALDSDWVDGQGIKPEKKPLFQKITKDLSLTPVGFVVVVEALTQYVAKLESPQLSLLIVELLEGQVGVTLVKDGQITVTKKVGRSGESVSDVVEALAHFKEKNLPTKIVLFSASLTREELSEIQQHLLKKDWTAEHPFLHAPMIDVYDGQTVLEAIVQTGGRAVAESQGVLPASPSKEETTLDTSKTTEQKIQSDKNNSKVKDKDFGFTETDFSSELETTASTFGVPVAPHLVPGAGEKDEFTTSPKSFLDRLNHWSHTKPFWHFVVPGVIAGLLVLLGVGTVFGQNAIEAKIVVELKTQPVTKEVTVTLDPQIAASDPDRLLLKAEVVKKQVSGQKTTDTTGKKVIGEKAKGRVTVYNRTTSPRSFAAGTTLANGTVSFTMDEAVSVASASTGQNFETTPGTAEVSITAKDIGTASNLAENIDLTIENFSKDTYVARTKGALTGGTSREIQAVAQQDHDKLLVDLRKELIEKAQQELRSESGNGRYIEPTNKTKVIDTTYDAPVGKETNVVTLVLDLEVEALSYQVSDLTPLARRLLEAEVPSGHHLIGQDPDITSDVTPTSTTSAKVALQMSLFSFAEPEVQTEFWKSEVVGKPEAEAQQHLASKPEVKQVTITRTPTFWASLFTHMPKKQESISIEVAPPK